MFERDVRIANARPLQPLPEQITDPDRIARLDIRRRDRLGGVLREYEHADAARLGLVAGCLAEVTSRVGRVELPVEVSDEIAPGVVSIPHGWGHDRPRAELSVARGHAGVNSNLLTDDLRIDPLSGTAVLNGVPVEAVPVVPVP